MKRSVILNTSPGVQFAKTLLSVAFLVSLFAFPMHSNAQDLSDEELLNMSLDDLMDIDVVNVSKINTNNLTRVPSTVTLVTSEQIEDSGAKNMEEVMRMVPGFDVIRTGFDPSVNVGVRGLYGTEGTNTKILFMVNDHPIRSIYYGDAAVFLGNYPVYNIKQIEIIRGPGSTLFGAGAFLAVINIRTKEADKNGEVFASTGSFNRQQVGGVVTHRFSDNSQVTLSGNYLTTDGAEANLNSDRGREVADVIGQTVGFTGPSVFPVPAPLNYGRHTLDLNLKASLKDFYLLASLMHSEDELPIGLSEVYSRDNNANNDAYYAEVGYRGQVLQDNGEILMKGYLDHYAYRAELNSFAREGTPFINYISQLIYALDPNLEGPGNAFGPNERLRQHRGAKNDVRGAEMNFAYNFQSAFNVIAGVMYEHHGLNDVSTEANGNFHWYNPMILGAEFFGPFESFGNGLRDLSDSYAWITENHRDIYAVFGQTELNLKNIFGATSLGHFRLVGGARYDHYSDVGGALNPRLALLLAPDENWYFKAMYGEAFRAPSFVELYAQNSSTILGNAELKPETTQTGEIVVGYRIGSKFDANLTYFNTAVDNNIQLVPDGDPSTITRRFDNSGDLRTSGLEGELKYTFQNKAYFMAGFNFQNVIDVSNDSIQVDVFVSGFDPEDYVAVQDDFDPGIAPGFILNFALNYPLGRYLNLHGSVNHLGERKRSQAKEFELGEGLIPTGRLVVSDDRSAIPARTLVNLSVTLHELAFAPGLELQFTGYNLLNQDNFNPTLDIRGDDLLRAGAHWNAQLSYRF